MQFVPMLDTNRGCSSFILGDESSGAAVIVDPLQALGIEAYVLTVQDLGLRLTSIAETHVHADHASLARALADTLHIPLALSRHAPARFPFSPLSDGQVLSFGGMTLTVWETPGHTPDSLSFLVTDVTRGPEPWAVLTGDSLFVGDVGRPDLVDGSPAAVAEASRQQYKTVRRLMTLPDYTEVWPAHWGASPCGGLFMSKKPQSTIGYERLYNRMLVLDSREEFLDYQQRLVKEAPEEASALRRANLGWDA